MVEFGEYFLPIASKQISVSSAHTQEDIDRTLEAIRKAIPLSANPPAQLQMRRNHLDELPDADLPADLLAQGYELRTFELGDEVSAAETLSLSFEDTWTHERVTKELAANDFVKRMFVVTHHGRVIATASAAFSDKRPTSGYVHYVGTHPDHTGKRLGYWVTLATLHEFKSLGYTSAILNTDDFRLPAIQTYLNLGFEPESVCRTHPTRWNAAHKALQKKPRS